MVIPKYLSGIKNSGGLYLVSTVRGVDLTVCMYLVTCVIAVVIVIVYMTDNILSALHLAGDILSDPSRRCTGTLATDKRGVPVDLTSTEACCWCLTGALSKACFELSILDPKDQLTVYAVAKDKIGIPADIASPVFWDMNEDLHQLIAGRLQKA